MALAEVADRSEVRRIERDNHHEIVPLAAGSSNALRRIQPACIAMQQKRNHHARIERRLAQPTHIAAHDRLEIQTLPHQPNDKPRDVVLGHEVPRIRRQKQRLIDIPGAKVLAHSPNLNQTRWDLNSDYSDRLLGEAINFERVRRQTALKLFVCATDVQTAKVKIFAGKELHADHVLASTCLPLLMQAVEIDATITGTVCIPAIPQSIRWSTNASRATSFLSTSPPPSALAYRRLRRRS